jgi:outer membrane protein TolC
MEPLVRTHITNSIYTKTIYFLLVGLFLSAYCFGQSPNANAVQKSAPATGTTLISDTGIMDIKEKLVQLALQNPELEIADRRIAIAEYEYKKNKTQFLNNIYVSGNLNEFSIKTNTPNQFFPRYNIGATIPLDLFVTRDKDLKIAKENIGIAAAEKNQRYRLIRAAVLSAYEDYLMNKEMLELQSQIAQDVYTNFLRSEKDFSQGIISQEEYNKSFKSYSDEQTKKITLTRNFNVSKLELERMIGVPIDEVIK